MSRELREKSIGFKISVKEAKDIQSVYPSLNFGATRAVKNWIYLRRRCLYTIKGIFSANELSFILHIQGGKVFNPKFDTEMFINEIEESNKYENLSEKWRIDIQQLCTKIKGLQYPYAFFFMEWADCYWNTKDEVKPEDYIESLL